MAGSEAVLSGKTIAVIGAGAMGGALMRGMLKGGIVSSSQLIASDVIESQLERARSELGVRTTSDNRKAVSESDVILLAVKPQVVPDVLQEIASALDVDRHLLISIAAGVTLETLQKPLPEGTPVIRVMPNTPCLVLAGASAISPGKHAKPEHLAIARAIFGAAGVVVDVEEKFIDAVTALSGSGPAYVYLFIEALSDAGVRCGLARDVATKLAAQTVLGGAKMVLETGKHPGELKDMVTSPAGTTIAALAVLEKNAFRGAVIEAVTAAYERAKELGRDER